MKTYTLSRYIFWLIGICMLMYVLLILYLWVFQESLIFHSHTMTEERWQEVAEETGADYMTMRMTKNGEHLQGWFLHDKSGLPRPTILFFGGNAQKMEDMVYTLAPLVGEEFNILLMDYRGYGLSEGKPSMAAFKNDAEILFEGLSRNVIVDPDRIIVWGQSLGTSVATHLASKKSVQKIILFSPMTSIADTAHHTYPFVPTWLIKLLLRHESRSIDLAPQITTPALIIHGENDKEIPFDHAQKIADVWGGDATLKIIPEAGHNDLLGREEVWKLISDFIKNGAAHEI